MLADINVLKTEKLGEEDMDIVNLVKMESDIEGIMNKEMIEAEECKDAVETAGTEIVGWKTDIVKSEQVEEQDIIVDISNVKSEIGEDKDTEDKDKAEIEAQEAAIVKTEIKKEEDIHIAEVGETEIMAVAPAIVLTEMEDRKGNKKEDIDGVAEEQDGDGSSSSEKLQPQLFENPPEYEHSYPCQRQFTRKHNMVAHLRTHTAEKPYKCDVCHQRFKSKGSLDRHGTDTHKESYKCNICQRKFCFKSALKRHLSAHTGEKPYECSYCQSKFTQKGHLKRHLETHTGEPGQRPHECEVCHKRFFQKHALKNHTRKHTGEKPYECDVCQKRFAITKHLKNHFKTHTGERPHECDVCQKRFSQKNALRDHIRTHTGEKPHECSHCQRKFTKKSNFTRHLKTHTSERHINVMFVKNGFFSNMLYKII